MSFRVLGRRATAVPFSAVAAPHWAGVPRRSYVTITQPPGSLPRPGVPAGSWAKTGINPTWHVQAECKTRAGAYVASTTLLPYAFSEIENVDGQLKLVNSFHDAGKVPTASGTQRNGYALIGGSFNSTSRNTKIVFQAEVKNAAGTYVPSTIAVGGTGPVELENVDGKLVLKK